MGRRIRTSRPLRGEEALQRLSRHYIPARYVDAHASGAPGRHYGAADAKQALADADAVLGFVDGLWQDLERAAGGR